MTPTIAAVVGLVFATGTTTSKAFTIDGRVAPAVNGTAAITLAATDGNRYLIAENDASRMLFLDPQLHDRPLRLTVTRLSGAKLLKVERVQAVKDGKLFDLDYWCENCQLDYAQPGICICCGGETALRERPAK